MTYNDQRRNLVLPSSSAYVLYTFTKRTEGWQNRPRPVLVRLKSEKMKWEILTNARKLKNAENQIMRKVGITKDMTKKEREDSMRLRMELKEKHEKGEGGWMIKNGKLVREDGVKKKMYK